MIASELQPGMMIEGYAVPVKLVERKYVTTVRVWFERRGNAIQTKTFNADDKVVVVE